MVRFGAESLIQSQQSLVENLVTKKGLSCSLTASPRPAYNEFMIALLLTILGVLLSLAGLVAVGPQVRVHQIAVNSKAAWLFKIGSAVLILGELFGVATSLDPTLVTVSLLMGGAILFASLAIGSHERQQDNFDFKASFSLQVFGLGVIIVLLTFLLR